jgi:uncharacterized protein YjiS (DUF1127 family)
MSTIALARPHPRLSALIHRIAELIAGCRDGLALAERYHALSALSHSELAKLGLTRADISRVVATGTAIIRPTR